MSIKFKVVDSQGERMGRFSDADYWDYNDIAKEIDVKNDIPGAIDWINYNVALTEDIFGIISFDDSFIFEIYDICDVYREDDLFDEDPIKYLLCRPELMVCKYFDFSSD